MTDGIIEKNYFDIYPKEKLSQLASSCIENIKRIRQKFTPISLDVGALGVEEITGEKIKPIVRQTSDIVFNEDPLLVYKRTLEETKLNLNSESAIPHILTTKDYMKGYIKTISEETEKLKQVLKEISELLRKKNEEMQKETRKLIQLYENLIIVQKSLSKISSDVSYLKIPQKFEKSAAVCKIELLRRKVFTQIALDFSRQFERLFEEELGQRKIFQNKTGKYVPKVFFSELKYTIPELRISEMLQKCNIKYDVDDSQKSEIIKKYYQTAISDYEKNIEKYSEIHKTLNNENKNLYSRLKDIEQKLLDASTKKVTAEANFAEAERKLAEQVQKSKENETKLQNFMEKLNKSELQINTNENLMKENLQKIAQDETKIKELNENLIKTELEKTQFSTENSQNLLIISQYKQKCNVLINKIKLISSEIVNLREKMHTFNISSDLLKYKENIILSLKNQFSKLKIPNILPIAPQPNLVQNEQKINEFYSQIITKIVQLNGELKIQYDKNLIENSQLLKFIDFTFDSVKSRIKKISHAFNAAREKLIEKTKKETDLHVSTMMSVHQSRMDPSLSKMFPSSIMGMGNLQNTKLISYENFAEGSNALFFRMRNGMFQAINNKNPFYFIDNSQLGIINPEDCLICGKIKSIRQDKKLSEQLVLPKGKFANLCTIEIIFKTYLK